VEPVYSTVVALVSAAFRGMGYRIDVQGAEHLPRRGGAVIATNHVGYLDFTFIGYGAKPRGRLVRFLAKREVFDRRGVGALMHGMHHIPVDRFGRAAESYRVSLDALARGELLGMFPEGTISPSFVPMAGKTGAARMAMAAGVPLLPGAVWGTQRILTKGRPRNLQRGIAVSVRYGPPVPYRAGEDPDVVTERLMTAIGDLVRQAQRDYPQQPAGPDDRWWLPAHLGGTAPTVEVAAAAMAEQDAARRAARKAERQRRATG